MNITPSSPPSVHLRAAIDLTRATLELRPILSDGVPIGIAKSGRGRGRYTIMRRDLAPVPGAPVNAKAEAIIEWIEAHDGRGVGGH